MYTGYDYPDGDNGPSRWDDARREARERRDQARQDRLDLAAREYSLSHPSASPYECEQAASGQRSSLRTGYSGSRRWTEWGRPAEPSEFPIVK